jgi:hypothetical protein
MVDPRALTARGLTAKGALLMTISADKESRSRVVQPARALTPGRIVALALIGLVVLGLAYLRFVRDSDTVSVPKGAKAGDLILDRSRGIRLLDERRAARTLRLLMARFRENREFSLWRRLRASKDGPDDLRRDVRRIGISRPPDSQLAKTLTKARRPRPG